MHDLEHIRTVMPWAPLPSDFDGQAHANANADCPYWMISAFVFVSYSGDADWASVELAHGTVRVALHYSPHNNEPWAASCRTRRVTTIPLMSGATPAEAIKAATSGVELPPTLVTKLIKLIQHVETKTQEPTP